MNDVDIVTQFNRAEVKRNKRKRRKERVKSYIKEYLKYHPCMSCGTNDNLTFHHKNPKEKRMTVARLVSYKSIEAIQMEINKCDVLCRHCHDVTHHMGKGIELEVDSCVKPPLTDIVPATVLSIEEPKKIQTGILCMWRGLVNLIAWMRRDNEDK